MNAQHQWGQEQGAATAAGAATTAMGVTLGEQAAVEAVGATERALLLSWLNLPSPSELARALAVLLKPGSPLRSMLLAGAVRESRGGSSAAGRISHPAIGGGTAVVVSVLAGLLPGVEEPSLSLLACTVGEVLAGRDEKMREMRATLLLQG